MPGTDDEEGLVHNDLVTREAAFFDDDGASTFPIPNDNVPSPIQDERMEVDGGDSQSGDRASSPLPTRTARRLRNPRIEFVFNELTGDFVESYPTIYLSRRPAQPEQNLRRSTCPPGSPPNPNAAYLQLAQVSHPDAKKKKSKDTKNRDKTLGAAVPRKRARNDDDTAQLKDNSAPKKPKLKETIVIDEDKRGFLCLSGFILSQFLFLAAVATKAICKCGPGPSKPPPVTLGVSGGGFGEKVPPLVKVVRNGVKSIGVLVVDKDFGEFVEFDKSYWSKSIAPFVGE